MRTDRIRASERMYAGKMISGVMNLILRVKINIAKHHNTEIRINRVFNGFNYVKELK